MSTRHFLTGHRPKEWEENGKPNLVEQATARKEQILASPPPSHISDQLDSTLREKYPVHLGEKNRVCAMELG